MEKGLEGYEIDKGARPIFDFVDDLSTWYVRRSRDRFKGEGEDKKSSIETTRFVLREFSKLIAPYIPFVAEEVYKDVGGELESVHLESWPELVIKGKGDVLENMTTVREVVRLGLEARQKAGVKVRQPLQKIQITEKLDQEYLDVIADELNVKEVYIGSDLVLDTVITPELEKEGQARELIREIQKMRKEAGLNPEDKIKLNIPEESKDVYEDFQEEIKNITNVIDVSFGGEIVIEKL